MERNEPEKESGMRLGQVKNSIKNKLIMLSAVVAVPFLIMVVYLLYALIITVPRMIRS